MGPSATGDRHRHLRARGASPGSSPRSGPVHGSCSPRSSATRTPSSDYDVARARRLVTLKLVGYTEVVHALLDRLEPTGGTGHRAVRRAGEGHAVPRARRRCRRSTAGSRGCRTRSRTSSRPIRVNALHPGIIGDSPFWAAKPPGVLDKYTAPHAGRRARDDGRRGRRRRSSCSTTGGSRARASTSTGAGASPRRERELPARDLGDRRPVPVAQLGVGEGRLEDRAQRGRRRQRDAGRRAMSSASPRSFSPSAMSKPGGW